jgi:hypothetical protein
MKTSPYLLLAFSLLNVCCSKDSPVGPSTTAPPVVTATAIIGTSGGTLSCEGFTIKIPASAFSKAETLTVQQETYDGSFGSLNVTHQFRLEGLPARVAGNVDISLKCTRTPTSGIFIGTGNQGVAFNSGETRVLYDLLPAILDSGYLKVTLTPASLGRALGKTGNVRSGGGFDASFWTGFDQMDTLKSSAGHFKVIHPRSSIAIAVAVAKELEEAYIWFDQMGFNRGTYSIARWPVRVEVAGSKRFLGNDLVNVCMGPKGGSPNGVPELWIGINENEWDHGIPEFRKWLFTCFATVFCSVHDDVFHSSFDNSNILAEAKRIWPYYAIAAWAGAKAHLPGYDSLPPFLGGRKLTPLHGLQCPSGAPPSAHGLGMTALMKHFADVYGERTPADLYHAVRNPATSNAIDLLFNSIQDPENIWWPEFMKRYLSGEIYAIPADTFLVDLQAGTEAREFTISGKNDTLKYFSADYRDLSAKLYRVNLRYLDISSSAAITFEIGSKVNLSYAHILVFGLKDHKLEYWAKSSKVTVTKLKDLTAAGYDIVAAVVNSANESPYNGSMSIDLDVKVETPAFSLACIKVRTAGVTKYYDGSLSPTSYSIYNAYTHFREVRLTNGHFIGTWDDVTTVRNYGSWDIVADLSSNPMKVTYFKAEETTVSGDETVTWKVEASKTCAIPGGKSQVGSYFFQIKGTDVGKHILPVYNRLENPPASYWWELVTTSFDNDSYIEITIE